MWKIAWLKSLLFWVAIDLDLQCQIWFKMSNCLVSPLLEIHNHHITSTEPSVPRLLHRPDFSWSPSSVHTYIPRLFHGPDCFTVSTRCTHTDLGSRRYFGVYRLSCSFKNYGYKMSRRRCISRIHWMLNKARFMLWLVMSPTIREAVTWLRL